MMKTADIKPIRSWFCSYSGSFLGSGAERDRILRIKIDHSERVAREAAELARDSGWNSSSVNLAEAAGWLHDTGRFSQYADFATFCDAISVNHGERGREVVQESGVLRALSVAERGSILQSIRHHNSRSLPTGLDGDALKLARLTRDADKLDIFRVVHGAIEENGFRDLPELQPGFRLDGPLNPLVMDELETSRSCSFKHVKSLADFMLIQLSWIHDINYDASFLRMKQRRIIGKIASHLPRGKRVDGIIEAAQRLVSERARRRKAH